MYFQNIVQKCFDSSLSWGIQNTEYGIQNTEYGKQNAEYRIQNTETHEHKTNYGPLIDMAIYVMFLMWENPLLGQVGRVWAL